MPAFSQQHQRIADLARLRHGQMNYEDFLFQKTHWANLDGFSPVWMPDFLFPFQRALVDWAIRKGRAAIFADCGLGKTPMQLVWAENVIRKTNKRVLIVTPLAVGAQTIREGEKFGIECRRSSDGRAHSGITVTNYERLHHFDPVDFVGAVCDESSAIKHFDGKRRAIVTEFLRTLPYRLLCTATAAPNDYIELGTSSEALGMLGYMDMLTRFFRNQNNNATDTKGHWRGFHAPRAFEGKQWRFKKHAERPFWRWVCSWARATRKPSDLGFEDDGFILPPLTERETIVKTMKTAPGYLFPLPAVGLKEQREEARRTIEERCARAASIVAGNNRPAVIWCHLNAEADELARIIADGQQVSGSDSDDAKEEKFLAFSSGRLRVLITKPKIGAFGLNWQHCSNVVYFPSHSYESYYQAVRRCWRFGQERPVTVDLILTEGGKDIMANLKRKSEAADRMFSDLVACMNEELHIERSNPFSTPEEVPAWL